MQFSSSRVPPRAATTKKNASGYEGTCLGQPDDAFLSESFKHRCRGVSHPYPAAFSYVKGHWRDLLRALHGVYHRDVTKRDVYFLTASGGCCSCHDKMKLQLQHLQLSLINYVYSSCRHMPTSISGTSHRAVRTGQSISNQHPKSTQAKEAFRFKYKRYTLAMQTLQYKNLLIFLFAHLYTCGSQSQTHHS